MSELRIEIPMQPEGEGGWIVHTHLLRRITKKAKNMADVDMEDAEAVICALLDIAKEDEAKPAQETGEQECRIYNEDDLPPMSEAEYGRWFNHSYIPDGIGCRIGPWPLPEPPR